MPGFRGRWQPGHIFTITLGYCNCNKVTSAWFQGPVEDGMVVEVRVKRCLKRLLYSRGWRVLGQRVLLLLLFVLTLLVIVARLDEEASIRLLEANTLVLQVGHLVILCAWWGCRYGVSLSCVPGGVAVMVSRYLVCLVGLP